jgi:uncharacterized protein (TIGR04255 family)
MSSRRPYANAPITEAIIDLRVELPAGTRLPELEYVHKRIKDDYPTKIERKLATGSIEVGLRVSATAQAEQIGFAFTSADKKQTALSLLSGFTFGRQKPYESWDPFRDEARRVWGFYRAIAKPTKVTRLAIRNINRIDIPKAYVELKDYFRTSPEISPDLPQQMDSFFMQAQLSFPDLDSIAIINQTAIPPSVSQTVSIILDIDLQRGQNVPQDEDAIWACFEELRTKKDEIFEACITDASRELFK